jgi:hypothetical protein
LSSLVAVVAVILVVVAAVLAVIAARYGDLLVVAVAQKHL